MFKKMFRDDGFMVKKALPFFSKIGEARFIQSINSGLFYAMPMTFVGVVLQIVGAISSAVLGNYPDVQALISILQDWGFGLMGLFICIGVAKTSAEMNKIVADGPIVFALTVYFILLKPVFGDDGSISFSFDYLGSQGLTLALIAGFAGAEICALFERKGWVFKVKNLPEFMTPWLSNLLAGTFLVVLTWLIVYVWDIDVMVAIQNLISPILVVSDTLPSLMIWGLMSAISFAVGIHPAAVSGIFLPLLFQLSAENADLLASGLEPTAANGFHFATLGYVFALINTGGACATLGLNILMLFSKNQGIKNLGRLSIVPSLIKVNEPLIFGLPIVFNPLLALGALLVNGIVNPVLAYVFFMTGLIPAATNPALLIFFPGPVVALLNNMGIAGFLASLFIIAVDVLVWFPFFKIHEKQRCLADAKA